MKSTRLIMGMPVTVNILDARASEKDINAVFNFFSYVDNKFSTYKSDSEISKINQGLLKIKDSSEDMRQILRFCEETKKETEGYFEINHFGTLDPSGLVKGWAINNAVKLLKNRGLKNYYINAGGDIQVGGRNKSGTKWRIGIENPFDRKQMVKVIGINTEGVATSGTYIRGQHIYDPHQPDKLITEIISLTVVGPDIYEADRFATAAFAMGLKGLDFISGKKGFAGYMIDKNQMSFTTPNFDSYVLND